MHLLSLEINSCLCRVLKAGISLAAIWLEGKTPAFPLTST